MKKIGNCIYVHKSNICELTEKQYEIVMQSIPLLPYDFKFEVIKYNKKDNSVTFIDSEDWNTSREPTVGDAYKIKDSEVKYIKSKGQIYHHKWQFVSDDYDGFDVAEAKKWSEIWQNTLPKTKEVKNRIGYKKFWEEILKKYKIF